MRAISIRQPWAWAIIHAGKDIENRSWPTYYRGPVLIHAAKGMTLAEYDDFHETYERIRHALPKLPPAPVRQALQRGGIIGKARIIACANRSTSPWFFGPWGFVLTEAEPLPFQPLKGALGFFEIGEPASRE